MYEYTYSISKSLDEHLRILNRIIIRLDRHALENTSSLSPDFLSFKKNVFQNAYLELQESSPALINLSGQLFNFNKKNQATSKEAKSVEQQMQPLLLKYNPIQKKVLEAFLNLYNDESDLDNCTSGRNVFSNTNVNSFLQPLIGEKDEGNLYNKNLVTGARFNMKDIHISYRVDYDPIKKMHINLLITFIGKVKKDNIDLKYALPVSLDSKSEYYSASLSNEATLDEQMQIIKYKYELKMSHDYYHFLKKPDSENSVITSIDTNTTEEITKFFLGQEFDLPLLKFKFKSDNVSKDIQQKIFACKAPEQLHALFYTDAYVRDALLNEGIKHYSSFTTSELALPPLKRKASTADSEEGDRERSCKASSSKDIYDAISAKKSNKKRKRTGGDTTSKKEMKEEKPQNLSNKRTYADLNNETEEIKQTKADKSMSDRKHYSQNKNLVYTAKNISHKQPELFIENNNLPELKLPAPEFDEQVNSTPNKKSKL